MPWFFWAPGFTFSIQGEPVPSACPLTGLWPGNSLPNISWEGIPYIELLCYPHLKAQCPELTNLQSLKLNFIPLLCGFSKLKRERFLLNIAFRLAFFFFFLDFKDIQLILASNGSFGHLSVNIIVISCKIICSFPDFRLCH